MSVRTSVHKKFFRFQIEVDERCSTVCHMARSKVKVTGLLKFRELHFSGSISSAIYSGSWRMTTDSYTRAQYLNLWGWIFDISLIFVSRDLELGAVHVVSPSTKIFFRFQ